MPAPPAAASTAALDIPANARAEDALYPCSDGRPMADNMWQAQAILNAAGDLKVVRSEALVAADILVYSEEGNPKNRIAPDVLAAFGIGTHNRPTYLTWQEGKPPDWVLEVASPGTVPNDLHFKRHAYAAMGVPEYWLFDPQGDLFPPGVPRLQGLKLVDGKYETLEARLKSGLRTIRSAVLDLDLRAEGELIRFRDPKIEKDVRHRDETEAYAVQEAARAEQEAAQRKATQARVAELEASLGRALQRLRTDSSDDRP